MKTPPLSHKPESGPNPAFNTPNWELYCFQMREPKERTYSNFPVTQLAVSQQGQSENLKLNMRARAFMKSIIV